MRRRAEDEEDEDDDDVMVIVIVTGAVSELLGPSGGPLRTSGLSGGPPKSIRGLGPTWDRSAQCFDVR